jgi:hypothetical protein
MPNSAWTNGQPEACDDMHHLADPPDVAASVFIDRAVLIVAFSTSC